MDSIKEHLQNLYPDCWEELEQRIEALTESWKLKMGSTSGEALYPWVSKDDVMLITYGDGIKREGEAPLATLRSFLNEELSEGDQSGAGRLGRYRKSGETVRSDV